MKSMNTRGGGQGEWICMITGQGGAPPRGVVIRRGESWDFFGIYWCCIEFYWIFWIFGIYHGNRTGFFRSKLPSGSSMIMGQGQGEGEGI